MADKSSIEWTDATWNPIVGCSIVSPGCTNCYAMKMAARIDKMTLSSHYEGLTERVKDHVVWNGKIARAPDYIFTQPLRWKRVRKIFVNSMGDLFHESIPDEWIDRVFAVMALCPQHTFQVLTKRAQRMRDYCSKWNKQADLPHVGLGYSGSFIMADWPLPNVWLGVSAERQKEANERIPHLLATPAAVRFISAEPLLDRVSLRWAKWDNWKDATGRRRTTVDHLDGARMLDWVIVGGESGPRARPFHLKWADEIVSECAEANVPCFVKQFGANVVGPHANGVNETTYRFKNSKGGDWNEWPERLRVRQFPQTAAPGSPVTRAPQNVEVVVP